MIDRLLLPLIVLGGIALVFLLIALEVRANIRVCQEYFPKLDLISCILSDKTRVLP